MTWYPKNKDLGVRVKRWDRAQVTAFVRGIKAPLFKADFTFYDCPYLPPRLMPDFLKGERHYESEEIHYAWVLADAWLMGACMVTNEWPERGWIFEPESIYSMAQELMIGPVTSYSTYKSQESYLAMKEAERLRLYAPR